jgi:dienelactone hydrolase
MRFFFLASALLLIALVFPIPARADYVARTEVIPIQTMTLTDEQFLLGSQDGKPAVLAGVLRIPRIPAQGQRLPAVILLHGSGGAGSNIDYWEQRLNALGIATFAIDDFTGRGILNTTADQSQLGFDAPIVDVYRALETLAARPWIDPNRIALMGFSRGGTITLYSSLTRFQKAYLHGPATFAAYISFYPTCNTRFIGDEDLSDKPIRVFNGLADDYVPPEPCKAYVERLRKANKDVQITQYPGANHAFDSPAYAGGVFLATAQTRAHCDERETSPAHIINTQTNQVFTIDDACVGHGAHVQYDPAAAAAATDSVTQFLRGVFALQ